MDDVYTTAKWANRMLRPLTSLHNRLGKYRELQSIDTQRPAIITNNGATATAAAAASISESLKWNSKAAGDADHDSDGGSNDPSWIPRKLEAKRVKHKYVTKGERARGRARFKSVLHSPEAVKTLPGAIEIATPLITGKTTDRRMVFELHQEPHGSKNVKICAEHKEERTESPVKKPKRARFPKPDPQWRVSLDSAKDMNYVDIVQRLDMLFLKFLEKTRLPDSQSPRSTSGSRSLLRTVMRQLPQFIAEEQCLQDELDVDDDIDMADAYFTELEAAYGASKRGWQPLREAVRSQGIFLVCNMVQENWITHLTASTLVYKCIGAKENDAAESLLSAILLKLDYCDFPDSFDPWRLHQYVRDPLRLLHKYWTVSENNTFVFKEVERLVRRKALPAEWMVTRPWKLFVASATKSVSNGDSEYAAATSLITAIMETAADVYSENKFIDSYNTKYTETANRRYMQDNFDAQTNQLGSNRNRCPLYIQDALSNLISSLVVALCSMYHVRMEQPTNFNVDSSARFASILSGMALSLQRGLSVKQKKLKDDQTKAYLLRKGYILLGHFLLGCKQDTKLSDPRKVKIEESILSQDCGNLFKLLEQNGDIVKELSAMVSQIVRCCERGDEQAQCRRARKLCTHLLEFERLGMDNLTLFLDQVVVEVALDFAQYSQDAEDHVFAAEVQEAVSSRRVRLKSTNRSTQRPGSDNTVFFRWEEGIGEWIAKTPLMRTKGVMPRFLVESVTKAGSPSSLSEEASNSPSSVGNSSSRTSMASSSPSIAKRKNFDPDSPLQRTKRPRTSYDRSRQSKQMPTKQSNVLVVIHTGERNNVSHENTSDYESDYDSLNDASENDEHGDGDNLPIQKRNESEDEKDAHIPAPRGSVARQKQKKVNLEVIIHNCATTATTPGRSQERGRGRPPKQVAQRQTDIRRLAPLRQGLPQQRTVIPCSEDEDSDDELSFL